MKRIPKGRVTEVLFAHTDLTPELIDSWGKVGRPTSGDVIADIILNAACSLCEEYIEEHEKPDDFDQLVHDLCDNPEILWGPTLRKFEELVESEIDKLVTASREAADKHNLLRLVPENRREDIIEYQIKHADLSTWGKEIENINSELFSKLENHILFSDRFFDEHQENADLISHQIKPVIIKISKFENLMTNCINHICAAFFLEALEAEFEDKRSRMKKYVNSDQDFPTDLDLITESESDRISIQKSFHAEALELHEEALAEDYFEMHLEFVTRYPHPYQEYQPPGHLVEFVRETIQEALVNKCTNTILKLNKL